MMGLAGSSIERVAGDGGQLLPENTVPKKSAYQGHMARLSIQPAIESPAMHHRAPCSFGSDALDRGRWRVIQPQDNLILLQSVGIHVIPIGSRLEVKVIALCHRLEKWDRLHREIDVILFDIRGVKGENMKGPALGKGRKSRAGQ